jgi:hypothetical protein
MDAFSDFDPVIARWVDRLASTLFTEWAGAPARYFWTAGDPPFESFQISIGPPVDGRIKVYARATDTNDDTDDQMDTSWEGSSANLDKMLATAVEVVNGWKARKRIKPDPPQPWD